MSSFFTSFRRNFIDARIRGGRARARTELLRMNDRTLEDAGFSRSLLEAGVHAWPWRTVVDAVSTGDQTSAVSMRRAEQELQRLSDRELDDLAIARTDIPRAVREGRIGVELPVSRDRDYPAAA